MTAAKFCIQSSIPLGKLNLAIVASGSVPGERKTFFAEESSKQLFHVTIPLDVLRSSSKLMQCLLLPHGSIASHAYLVKNHLLDPRICRKIDMYTFDYAVTVDREVEDIASHASDRKHTSQKLVTLIISRDDSERESQCDDKIIKTLQDKIQQELNLINCERERGANAMQNLHRGVAEAVKVATANEPQIEVVMMAENWRCGPFDVKLLSEKEKWMNKSLMIVQEGVPLDYLVARSAYLSTAVAASVIDAQSQAHREKVMSRSGELFDLCNLASTDMVQAASSLPKLQYHTKTVLMETFNANCTGGKQKPLLDALFEDLCCCKEERVSDTTQNFYTNFGPFTHGIFNEKSKSDPYRSDLTFIPSFTEGTCGDARSLSVGKEVATENFENPDCEVLSAKCLAYFLAECEAARAWEESPELIPKCTDRKGLLKLVLSLGDMAAYPIHALGHVLTHEGDHVVHVRFAPNEEWKASKIPAVQHAYTEAQKIKERCTCLIGQLLQKYNDQRQSEKDDDHLVTNLDAASLIKKVERCYSIDTTGRCRVQDCTVANKTENDFGFLDTLLGIYMYKQESGCLCHFAPQRVCGNSFHKQIESVAENPDLFIKLETKDVDENVVQLTDSFKRYLKLCKCIE